MLQMFAAGCTTFINYRVFLDIFGESLVDLGARCGRFMSVLFTEVWSFITDERLSEYPSKHKQHSFLALTNGAA